jgi:N-carbamoylputrescine amidase
MRVGFVEWPEDLHPIGSDWERITDLVAGAQLDLLVTNELPFGRWIAAEASFDPSAARASIDAHLAGLDALQKLRVPAILSSRPVWAGTRLANEAFVADGGVVWPVHQKQYFPEEPGWYEAFWYVPGHGGFRVAEVAGLLTGVMLCTDAMFNEHARRYGRQGASLIAIPRAAGTSTENWLAAGKMAAIVSGSYVISSNRVGSSQEGVVFGGAGFAYHPDGSLLAMTSAENSLLAVDVDPEVSAHQRGLYPRYVIEPTVVRSRARPEHDLRQARHRKHYP